MAIASRSRRSARRSGSSCSSSGTPTASTSSTPLPPPTLRACLVPVSQILAPFCPFMSAEISDNLDGAEDSVHLCDSPEPGERALALEFDMGVAREPVRLGLAARGQAKLKIRQPLRAAVVVATG